MKKKILLVAHEFSPFVGSECEQGWKLCLNICKSRPEHDFYILASSANQFGDNNYKQNVEKYLKKDLIPENVTILFHDYNTLLKLLGRFNSIFRGYFGVIGLPPLFFLIYSFWQKTAFNFILRSYGQNFFDIVHIINKINFSHPGPWWKLDAKLFWGPTGGKNATSKIVSASLKEKLRNLYIQIYKETQNVKISTATASKIFVFDDSKFDSKNVMYLPESGIERPTISKGNLNKGKSLKVIFAGQYINRKGFDIFLDIVSHFDNDDSFSFFSSGKGEITTQEFRSKNYTDLGFIQRENFLNELDKMDILIMPSFREGTPQTIMEAITKNVLVISTDVGGIKHFISSKALIKYISRNQVKRDIINILNGIKSKHYENFETLLQEQKTKSQKLSWAELGKKISSNY